MPRNGLETSKILPAYDTKHLDTLVYDLVLPTVPKKDIHLELKQDNAAGNTTGTTLWLGGQVLAAYLLSIKKTTSQEAGRRPRAIDLGSGIGYTSLLLAASGYDVIATDLPILTDGILSENVSMNRNSLLATPLSGDIRCQPLDWMTGSDTWPETLRDQAFDLILSSDSIYEPTLVQPLLRTIHTLCNAARKPESVTSTKSPDIYIAYEHRDDAQYTSFRSHAEVMGFKVKVIPKGKVGKAVKDLYGWKAELYEGITVLHLRLMSK